LSIVPVNTAYRLNAKTGDAVQIGDPADAVFSPKVTLNRWNGECWLRLSFDDSNIEPSQKSVQLTDDKVRWATPLFDFRFYGVDQDDGGLELEIILKQKPLENTFSFAIHSQSLKFCYQPPLNQELDPREYTLLTETEALNERERVLRPVEVVGSYAVYHDSKAGGKYQAGKVFHVFRPRLTDADGKTAWAEFNADVQQTGVLTITLPRNFLETAKYPVVVDPTFGYTSIGASSGGDSGRIDGFHAAPASSGTVDIISAYVYASSGTTNIKCAFVRLQRSGGCRSIYRHDRDEEHRHNGAVEHFQFFSAQARSDGGNTVFYRVF